MAKQSSHARFKGCCWMCGRPKTKVGNAWGNTPFREMRKLGVKRRYRKSLTHWDDEA